jgi:two-component system response regulator GlrR
MRQQQNAERESAALSQAPMPEQVPRAAVGGTQQMLLPLAKARDEFTRGYLSQILQITGGNVSQAARLAKRNRTEFYKLLGRYQLLPSNFKKGSGVTRPTVELSCQAVCPG